jgi:hypothetical protein
MDNRCLAHAASAGDSACRLCRPSKFGPNVSFHTTVVINHKAVAIRRAGNNRATNGNVSSDSPSHPPTRAPRGSVAHPIALLTVVTLPNMLSSA